MDSSNHFEKQAAQVGAWEKLASSGIGCFFHTAVWNAKASEMYVWGGRRYRNGFQEVRDRDLWVWRASDNAWKRLPPPTHPFSKGHVDLIGSRPFHPVLFGHSAVWDDITDEMLVFGDDSSQISNALFLYKALANCWEDVYADGPRPPARLAHSVVWDSLGRKSYVFGGEIVTKRFGLVGAERANDLWTYNSEMHHWEERKPPGPIPPPRCQHTAVWDGGARGMWVFGGVPFDVDDVLGDLWVYFEDSNVWQMVTPQGGTPPALRGHSAVWDNSGRMYVFGGAGRDGEPQNDVWAYLPVSNSWERLTYPGERPSGRWLHSCAWDQNARTMYVFGGYSKGVVDELWAYTARAAEIARPRPAGRALDPAEAIEVSEPLYRGLAALDVPQPIHTLPLIGPISAPTLRWPPAGPSELTTFARRIRGIAHRVVRWLRFRFRPGKSR